MTNEQQRKKYLLHDAELRSEKNGESALPEIIGYASVFNQRIDMGLWTEEVLPGAFTESLARNDDVAALFNHDPNLVLGRTPKTLSLRQDDHGLHMSILPPDIEIGRSVVKWIERGDIKKASFGFYIDAEEADFTSKKPHFKIKKVTLFDVSPVTYPAYAGTNVDLKRSTTQLEQELDERIRKVMPEDESLRFLQEYRQRRIKELRIT